MIEYLTRDPHAAYVVISYAATAAILAGLVWSTLRASARARRDMEQAEAARGRR